MNFDALTDELSSLTLDLENVTNEKESLFNEKVCLLSHTEHTHTHRARTQALPSLAFPFLSHTLSLLLHIFFTDFPCVAFAVWLGEAVGEHDYGEGECWRSVRATLFPMHLNTTYLPFFTDFRRRRLRRMIYFLSWKYVSFVCCVMFRWFYGPFHD